MNTLIETGTFLGEMVKNVKDDFNKIYTIELDKELYHRANNKFKGYKKINVLQGNSSKILPDLLKNIQKPSLFWLDAHYSGILTARGEKNTPIREELNTIISHGIDSHVILIDDARCFTGNNDYLTIKEIKNKIVNHTHKIKIENDIIRIVP